MERELEDASGKCKSLKEDNKAKAAELNKALQKAREARSESRAAREEIRQAGEIAAGKPFLLQTKSGDPKYALLNQLWSSPDAFLDLPKSVADAAQFYQAQEGYVCNREAFLVTIRDAKAPAVAERTDGLVGRAPQDIRICHEGRRGLAVAD